MWKDGSCPNSRYCSGIYLEAVNNELQRMWKDGSCPNSRHFLAFTSRECGSQEIPVSTVHDPADILAETNQNIVP
jgi:hypothetical protein